MHKIILTFDLEYWFESLSLRKYLKNNEEDWAEDMVDKILSALQKSNSTATFFITGRVLDNEPHLIKKIFDFGHEIAIHSLDHLPLWDKRADQFDTEIKTMIAKIETVIGQKPSGHRAVNFSLDQTTVWALKVLVDNGIKYDSSVFPFRLPHRLLPFFRDSLYGLKSNLFSPYKINLDNPADQDPKSSLIEFPISVFHCQGFKLPLTGGIYIRLIPWLLFRLLLKYKLKRELACIHFHVFDFLDRAPKVKMPRFKKLIKFYNTKNTWHKLRYILDNFECVSLRNYYKSMYH